MILHSEIHRKCLPLLEAHRFKVLKGGRSSIKSQTVARALIVRGVAKQHRTLCAREVQRSIRESVHKLLSNVVREYNLGAFYNVERDRIWSPLNGSEFLFTGLKTHTSESIKSYEDFDTVWVEEAQTVSAESCNLLIPTIRKEDSEIWFTFNPRKATDYVYDRFVTHTDPEAVVINLNWRDNRWLSSVTRKEMAHTRRISEDLYRHIWEGELISASGLIFKRPWFRRYKTPPKNLVMYMSSDYAATPDAGDFTEHGAFGLDPHGNLYVVDWYYGQESPEVWIQAAIEMARRVRPRIWFDEKGVIRRSLDAAIAKRLREAEIWVRREGVASAGNKADRALGFAARASAGTVYFPHTEWADRVIDQLCNFTGEPGGVDDAVDVCSQIGRGLDMMVNAPREPAPAPAPPLPFTDAWFEAQDRMERGAREEREEFYG